MTIYNSAAVTNKVPATSHGLFGNVKQETATVTLTAAPTTADVINFFTIPRNSIIVGATVASSQIDSNGTPTVTLNVGDAGSAGRLFSALNTVGRTAPGSMSSVMAYGGYGYQYTADTVITGSVAANPATGVAGATVQLTVFYAPVGGAS